MDPLAPGQPVRHPTLGLGKIQSVTGNRASVTFASASERTVDIASLACRDAGICGQCIRPIENCVADAEHEECCQRNFQGDCYSNARKAGKPILRHGRIVPPNSGNGPK